MANILQQYFPAIRTQEEIMEEITENEGLWILWQNWNVDQQKEFLNFCTGIKGIKILYDSFFKEIMDPDTAPERLEELLSMILGQKIRILKVLRRQRPALPSTVFQSRPYPPTGSGGHHR